jgi:hypothetical protein
MYYYTNISFKELLKIISKIPISTTLNENDILLPFSKYKDIWNTLPNKKEILHFWTVLTEQCKDTFIPHPLDGLKLLILINLNKDTNHKCYLYLNNQKKIECLSIIYINKYEHNYMESTIEQYLSRLPLINAMFNFGLNINIDCCYWRYVHANLIIINNRNMYYDMLNDIHKSLCKEEQYFEQEPLYKGIIITKYLSSHPKDDDYHKNVLQFMTDDNLKDENNIQLYFKII